MEKPRELRPSDQSASGFAQQGMSASSLSVTGTQQLYKIEDDLRRTRDIVEDLKHNMGIVEQSVFPEIGTELLESPQGMNIAITIRNGANGAGMALLEAFSFPFRREEETVG